MGHGGVSHLFVAPCTKSGYVARCRPPSRRKTVHSKTKEFFTVFHTPDVKFLASEVFSDPRDGPREVLFCHSAGCNLIKTRMLSGVVGLPLCMHMHMHMCMSCTCACVMSLPSFCSFSYRWALLRGSATVHAHAHAHVHVLCRSPAFVLFLILPPLILFFRPPCTR